MPTVDRVQIRATLERWSVFITLTILCLIVGENYPFSNFPMYSSFAPNSSYIYLADVTGAPVPTSRFGLNTMDLKKLFQSNRQAELESKAGPDAAAGAALLHYLENLRAVPPDLLRGLQVRRVNLLWKSGRIEADTRTVARHP